MDIERLAGVGDWHGIRDLAHGLAGRAGMFGYDEIGEIARQVEEAIDAGREPGDQVAGLTARLRALD
jgi:HPt (histidine-containing phosphotransfer) domain-containing protein